MKVSKKIVIFPQKYKSISLSVDDAESFKEADEILIHEVSRYLDLLEPEDIEILKRTIGLVVIKPSEKYESQEEYGVDPNE